MAKQLVIVESPTKAKTISRFLGNDFLVVSSYGHVRDLPKNKLGVDVKHNFEPKYIVPTKARKVVTGLTQEANDAQTIYFATDEDREGEAISWHLIQLIKPADNKIKRIVFHEITREAIIEALANPRTIDINLVDAQQARRVLDRLVGYELSPFLWKKVAKGLSAGRVQSVAVRLIVEREREIKNFVSQEYWTIGADLTTDHKKFQADLTKFNNTALEKFSLTHQDKAEEVISILKQATGWHITNINSKTTKRTPPAPFTTSTLQQEAHRRLGFSVKQTMMLAQKLYEGIELGNEGSIGLITYMRTDSINLAQKFLTEVQDFIKQTWGEMYALPKPRFYKNKSKNAQEAHEAIRPTHVTRDPDSIKKYLDPREYKLYKLIWQRAVACQMIEASIENTTLEINDHRQQHLFKATGQKMMFDGWLKLSFDKQEDNVLPQLNINDQVVLIKLLPEQHFTDPPARYNEATLVKTLEEYGIGRPSTYAPTISTIIERGYVEKAERRLKPTDLAMLINDLLVEHFPEIVDYAFTATLEQRLDDIATGKQAWVPVIESFYLPFKGHLNNKEVEISKKDIVKERELGIDPVTGLNIKVRLGRFGPYIQLGDGDKDKKPKFVAIPRGINMEEITLAQARELLSLPRLVGTTQDGQEITAGLGRFGPYIKKGNEYRSLKEPDNMLTIDLNRAQEIFATQLPRSGTIAELGNDDQGNKIIIKAGRFGVYVTNGAVNATIPKNIDPRTVTLTEAITLIEKKTINPKGGRKKKA